MIRDRRFEKITTERKRELEQIMSRSNTIAKQVCYDLFGNRKYQLFRKALRTHNYDGFTKEQIDSIADIPDDIRAIITEVEEVSDEVVFGMMPLVINVAKSVVEKYELSDDKIDDLISEGWLIMLKAVYGYTDLTKDFGRYARSTLWHEFQRLVMKSQSPTVELQPGHAPADKDLLVDWNLDAAQSEGLSQPVEHLFKVTHVSDLERQVLLGSAAGVPKPELACLLGVTHQEVRKASWSAHKRIVAYLGRKVA